MMLNEMLTSLLMTSARWINELQVEYNGATAQEIKVPTEDSIDNDVTHKELVDSEDEGPIQST